MRRNRRSIELRWGIPIQELLDSIAAQGLSITQASMTTGMSQSQVRHIASGYGIQFERCKARTRVAALCGAPFSDAARAMAEAGKTRRQASELLGVEYRTFLKLLSDRPQDDEFPKFLKARQCLIDTGSTVVSVARDLASKGYCVTDAARFIGYASGCGLTQALAARGVEVSFPRRKPKPKPFRLTREPAIRLEAHGPHPWRTNWSKRKHERMGTSQE